MKAATHTGTENLSMLKEMAYEPGRCPKKKQHLPTAPISPLSLSPLYLSWKPYACPAPPLHIPIYLWGKLTLRLPSASPSIFGGN